MDLLTTYTHDSQLQATTAPPLISTIHKSPQHQLSLFPPSCVFISRSLVMASKSRNSTTSRAQSLSSQPPVQNSTELSTQLTSIELTAPTVLVITSRHEPYRKHRSSTVAFVSVTAGTCLPSFCPEMGCVKPFIKKPLTQQWALIRDRYPAIGLHATVC
jgi:hypothetical protein